MVQERQQSTGHETSRSSSGGEGGGQSWKGVVKASAELRLNNLAKSKGFTYLLELEA